jgi:hypothetical protein|tara:strand:- start:4062 stop:4982 length:921 start_codon:yes stop_codon:yes gene_type:complete
MLNNESIIIDAILTDEGRRRIAKGNFEVVKFSLHDDEIVYTKASQTSAATKFANTPIFEAVSENIKALKYNLLSLDGDYTHLNVTSLATQKGIQDGTPQATGDNAGFYVVISTKATYDDHYGNGQLAVPDGFLPGYSRTEIAGKESTYIKVDHGINDKSELGPYKYDKTLPAELTETQFMVKLDYRLGRIASPDGSELSPNMIDDDFIASYVITTNMANFTETLSLDSENASPILGARGPRLKIPIFAANDINTESDTIWDNLGREITSFFTNGTTTAKAIDAVLQVEGMTTNVNITIPLRFVKNA